MASRKSTIIYGTQQYRRVRFIYPVILFLYLVTAVLLLNGCSDAGESPEEKPIILLGLDGLEWDFVLPMIKQGRLPNITRMMERGYYGKLETILPTVSPCIWTSIATGKVTEKHGIHGFVNHPRKGKGKLTLIKSTDRKTKALWNILSDYKKKIWSIGWWATFPVEEINGIMVSQTNTLHKRTTPKGKYKRLWKGTLLKGVNGQVYPPDRQNELLAILESVEENFSGMVKQIFGEFPFPPSPLAGRLWDNCRWAFRADMTYSQIIMKLAKEESVPDLSLLYLGGPDVVGHRFLRYKHPELYKNKPAKEQVANFGNVIEDYYSYCDRVLGQLLAVYGSKVTVIIVSDHGMKPVNLEDEFNPDDPWKPNISGNHQDKPPGVFIAAGPLIRQSPLRKPLQSLTVPDLENVCSVLDITPIILTMMRIPVGKDMDGKAVMKIFVDDFRNFPQPQPVMTHDTAKFFNGQARRKNKYSRHTNDKEHLKQLRSLGYITD